MFDLFDIAGKYAVVTGASSGLGEDAAIAYAKAGVNVALLARKIERLELVKGKIEALGGRAIVVHCDVTDEGSVRWAANSVLQEFGRVDILLNNAGIMIEGGIDKIMEEEWDKTFDTNVKGQFLTCKYFVPQMVQNEYGKIVNIASVNAAIADKFDKYLRIAYNSSKAAVVGFTRAMAAAYGKYNITVNAVGPGLFDTQMTTELIHSPIYSKMYNTIAPAGRHARKGELNGTILYLSSDASSYVQGQFIVVDGGVSIV
ncbi:MAG TPA: SDR family oxidoreductase [Lachnospiraceae bacterium]|nr:SDR family oxidoreductase [Lachnospiraceae bacterium]